MAVPLSNLSATWATGASSVNTAIRMKVTDTSSAANSKLIEFLVNNISKFSVEKSGNTFAETITVNHVQANSINVINSTVINETEIFVTSNSINANIVMTGILTLRGANVEQSLNNTFTQANTAYAQANTARGVANGAYAQANTATSYVPAGIIFPFAGSTEPSGFLLCTGNAVSRTTFSTLFDVIGTTYGAGDGSTTFNLPDLRGRVIAGRDNMSGTAANRLTSNVAGSNLGATGGVQSHTMTTAEMPLHGHPARYSITNISPTGSGGITLSTASDANGTEYTGTPTSVAGQQIGGTGGGGSHNNVQPTIILNYIIKT